MEHHVKHFAHHIDACSQFAIASATGLPLDEVTSELGFRPMSNEAIANYLVRKGYANTYDCVYGADLIADISGRGVLTIQMYGRGHALAYEGGVIYDSNDGYVYTSPEAACKAYQDIFGGHWAVKMIVKVAQVQTREWAVGGHKTEEAV